MNKFLIATVLLYFLIPTAVYANLMITEVMYDPQGSDEGYEWIEVRNIGDSMIDLTTCSLGEQGVNHAIIGSGCSGIPSGKYALIADHSDLIQGDVDCIYDSSWGSLSNSGESLQIICGGSGDLVQYPDMALAGYSVEYDGVSWKESASEGGTPGYAVEDTAVINEGSSGSSTSVPEFSGGLFVGIASLWLLLFKRPK